MRNHWPRLVNGHNYRTTSPVDGLYNCIAWSIGVQNRYIWPDDDEQYGWPEGIQRVPELEAFKSFFAMMEFEPCNSCCIETGFWKVAIYANGEEVTHAARQLPNGHWASKLGDLVDIEHLNVSDVGGGIYGEHAFTLRRSTRTKLVIPKLHPPLGILRP